MSEWTVITFTKNHWILSIHSNFIQILQTKNVSWLHFSWATRYIDDRSPRFRRQTVRVEVTTGAIGKNSGILYRGRSQIQKHNFSRFRALFDYPAHSLQETVLPTNQWNWKAETLKVCLLLVWRVCDHMHLGDISRLHACCMSMSNEIEIFTEGCRMLVTWPSQKLKICIQTQVEKFTDSKNAILFDLRRKITKLSRKSRFRTEASLGACGRLAVLNWRSSSINTSF